MMGSDALDWILVPEGECAYGDARRPRRVSNLWWSKTHVTPAHTGLRCDDAERGMPLVGISFYEAIAIAADLGGRLPTSIEWEWAAAGREERLFPWGDQSFSESMANLRVNRIGERVRVGSFPAGATPDGLLDMAGNVWEWTLSKVAHDGAVIRGGSYNSTALYAQSKFLNAAPKELRSFGIGIRVVRER